MDFLVDLERKYARKHIGLFRLGVWSIFHTVSIYLISQLILFLKISNYWLALIIFGILMTVISGLINQTFYDRKLEFDKNFGYFVIVHAIAFTVMNSLFVPLSGFSDLFLKYLFTGIGVSFIARLAKRGLMKKIIIATLILLILFSLPLTGEYAKLLELGTFLLFTYITVMLTWLALKFINSLNMGSDLTNWGIRILGGLIGLFGILMIMSSAMVGVFAVASNTNSWMNNLPWIISICIIIIGAFMVFRSNRRYQMIGIWQD